MQIELLQALLDDVKGNELLRNSKKQHGYLKSISLLAEAAARSKWQQFEIELVEELRATKSSQAMTTALDIKAKIARRELELADLQVKLMEFHTIAATEGCFTKESAAGALRKIADDIEASDSLLFPKPPTPGEMMAYLESLGATTISGPQANATKPMAVSKPRSRKGTVRSTQVKCSY